VNILITNIWLDHHAGTEVGVRDMALELHRRGHHVEVYSPELGEVAKEIRNSGVFITDRLEDLRATPDIIHAQHFVPAMDVMLQFPGVPAVYMLHDRTHPADHPPKMQQIRKYIAVDHNCLERLLIDNGIPQERTGVLYNYVDLNRFKVRENIAEKPRKALVFSNYAKKDNHFAIIEEACNQSGIPVDVLGKGFGKDVSDPESMIHEYDLVFAKAKAAMEAMSTGAGVITCDFRGLGGFVTPAEFDHFRMFNFGMRTLNRAIEVKSLVEEIRKYNMEDIIKVTRLIRKEADFKTYMDKLLQIYDQAIQDFIEQTAYFDHQEYHSTIQDYIRRKSSLIVENVLRGVYDPNEEREVISRETFSKIKVMAMENRALKNELKRKEKSLSYRLGSAITFPLRKVFHLFRSKHP